MIPANPSMAVPLLRRTVATLVLALLGLMAAVIVASMPVAGQEPAGRIHGSVTSGTEGHAVPDGLILRLVVLDDTQILETIEATVQGGRYEVEAPARPERTYLPHLVYDGVDYFTQPVAFTDGATEARRDFLVYAATRETPQLAITSTTVTVLAIDRQAAQLGIEREDLVANPSDRVFVGDETGVTLRIPVPDGTVNAGGQSPDGSFAYEDGVVSTTIPLRPGMLTSVVTRYIVGYDAVEDRYRLRVTAPLASQEVTVRVPAGFARSLEPAIEARRAADERSGGAEDQVLRVAQSTGPLPPGGGVLVDLVGLSGVAQKNPLTETRGAAAATAIALLLVGGGVTAAAWRQRSHAA